MSEPLTDKYAICLDCGVEHEDRDAMYEHGKETMEANGNTSGVVATGHRSRVVNPTPEEVEARRIASIVDRAVDDALNEAYEDLDRAINRGDITQEQVVKELRGYSDFADGWDEWVAGDR